MIREDHKPLHVLPFDHRSSHMSGMFGLRTLLTPESTRFQDAAADYRAVKTTPQQACTRSAKCHREWVRVFEQARRT